MTHRVVLVIATNFLDLGQELAHLGLLFRVMLGSGITATMVWPAEGAPAEPPTPADDGALPATAGLPLHGITGASESCGAPVQVSETVCPYCQHIVGAAAPPKLPGQLDHHTLTVNVSVDQEATPVIHPRTSAGMIGDEQMCTGCHSGEVSALVAVAESNGVRIERFGLGRRLSLQLGILLHYEIALDCCWTGCRRLRNLSVRRGITEPLSCGDQQPSHLVHIGGGDSNPTAGPVNGLSQQFRSGFG